ncbi:MAG: aldolase [Bryobacteraceae bacterium]|nr:aldolase [Bryobacteraceae bacterium]
MPIASTVTAADNLWENPVKKLLRENKPVIGATITVPSVETASQLANAGFDFLWIEMEHSPITLETARNMILATRGLKAAPFIRVPANELWLAKRALDQGAVGVIFPFTTNAELARRAVAACKYPPEGLRGYGPGLATFRWPAPEGYAAFANRNVVVMLMIEEAAAINDIEQIAAVPGVDIMYIGTSDLSYSLGHPNDMNHPALQEAIAKVIDAGRRNKVAVGLPARSPEQMQEYVKQGITVFQSPADTVMLLSGARAYLEPLGKKGFDPKQQPLY